MIPARLRAIPSVEKVLQALGETGLPRPLVVEVVRRELKIVRSEGKVPAFEGVLARIRAAVHVLQASRIQPVINGTGILVHTNLGRAPLSADTVRRLMAIGSNYSNLEFDLVDGTRGGRAAYLEQALALLCGADAVAVVNNNAAALVLILRHFCRGAANEVVISRGELVQIGGGFRIPDVLESSGDRLREIGTTNQTSLSDYARAITARTALILKVHRSNFFMDGFVESPRPEELAGLARRKRIPFVEDLGSGAVVDTAAIEGLEHEPTPRDVVGRGADLVCFSGDKLLGGPQAGIVAGRRRFVDALKREPFFRALRCDKLILAALETTVDAYLRGAAGIPVLDMLRLTTDELRGRAERIVARLDGLPLVARVGTGRAQIGGGTLPRSAVRSTTVDLTHNELKPQELIARLRRREVPVIGYVARGVVKLDLRTIFPRQDDDLVGAIREVSNP
jgi:L-seryl-tRNA(Ser) seleniumtransferase